MFRWSFGFKFLRGMSGILQYENVVNETYSLIRYLSAKSDKVDQVRKTLTRYHSLLYYTGIDHAILEQVLPITATSADLTFSLVMNVFSNLVAGLPFAFIRFAIFFPTFLFHVPGYVLSQVALKAFDRREEEAKAQFSGVGYVVGVGLSVLWLAGKFRNWGIGFNPLGLFALGVMVYSTTYILVQWHMILIRGLWLIFLFFLFVEHNVQEI